MPESSLPPTPRPVLAQLASTSADLRSADERTLLELRRKSPGIRAPLRRHRAPAAEDEIQRPPRRRRTQRPRLQVFLRKGYFRRANDLGGG
jgi:hypothetical protein